MRTFQFIKSGVGCGTVGKNAKVIAMHSHKTAMPLTQMPNLPSENFEGRRTSFRHRLTNMHEMLIAYDDNMAQVPIEATVLKATVLPILIRDRPTVMPNETRTLFKGISQPGRT